MNYRTGIVTEILEERPGLQRVGTSLGRAYVLTQVVPTVAIGDEVVLNTTGVDLDLGTGGWHVVHWNLSVREWSQPGPGHIMKLRYTSLQVDTGSTEEHLDGNLPETLNGTPVLVCTAHSQVAAASAVLHWLRPDASLVYVMTDGACLPLPLSDLVVKLRDRGILQSTVTAGHAFGGDYEAVSIPSALAVAGHVAKADAIVVGMGPGVVGTGTSLGTTAVEAATVLDAVSAMGGQPVLCLRMSDHDPRERHQGVSHHVDTVLGLVQSDQVIAPHPRDWEESGSLPDCAAILDGYGLEVTTMGRRPSEDPRYFDACAAAAATVASLLPERQSSRPSSSAS